MALVIDLAKPDSCEECRFHRKHMYRENGYMHMCDALQRAEQDGTRWLYGSCPILGEIPDTHGRLIDAGRLEDMAYLIKGVDGRMRTVVELCSIQDAPTVVEAVE